jgi:CRISPR/Cas system CSM-associated protein Csm3 (group 7 of RAMP superfamily)
MLNEDLWILELKATAVSPLYTGENKIDSQKRRKQGNLLPTRMSGDGFASISIFGAIRGYAEKIYKDAGTCDTGKDTKGCGRCLTCDMFGNLGRKGRVAFEDLKSVRPFDKVVERTVHPHIDRETGTLSAGKGASIELEEIVEGTELTGRIIIKNPTEKDIEVINAALKAAEDNGIGGWTRRGKGRVKFEVTAKKVKWAKYKEQGAAEANNLVSLK